MRTAILGLPDEATEPGEVRGWSVGRVQAWAAHLPFLSAATHALVTLSPTSSLHHPHP